MMKLKIDDKEMKFQGSCEADLAEHDDTESHFSIPNMVGFLKGRERH